MRGQHELGDTEWVAGGHLAELVDRQRQRPERVARGRIVASSVR